MKRLPKLLTFFLFLALAWVLASLYAIFIYAPIEKTMGVVQKIFYIHVPSAFLAFMGFFITFIASICYLYRKEQIWDIVAHSAAEVGVLFCTIVLITGPLWARPIWNVWWTWDPRLTTTLILWFIYAAYLILRRTVPENQRANLSAVFGIIGFINVPLTFFSIRLWRSIHPIVITGRGINISAPMKLTLLITFVAFCSLFLMILWGRIKYERLERHLDALNSSMEEKEYQ